MGASVRLLGMAKASGPPCPRALLLKTSFPSPPRRTHQRIDVGFLGRDCKGHQGGAALAPHNHLGIVLLAAAALLAQQAILVHGVVRRARDGHRWQHRL